MPDPHTFTIAVLPGDGIGGEIMPPCLDLASEAAAIVGGSDSSSTTWMPVRPITAAPARHSRRTLSRRHVRRMPFFWGPWGCRRSVTRTDGRLLPNSI